MLTELEQKLLQWYDHIKYGYNKDPEKEFRISTHISRETHGMIQKKMVQLVTGRQQEEMCWALKGGTVGWKKRSVHWPIQN